VGRIIAGRGRGRRLAAPRGEGTRPTSARVRQTLFDILAPRVRGCRFLDAPAGAGGVGLEALSRGAERLVLIEKDPRAMDALRRNASLFPGADVRIYRQDVRVALEALAERGARFDVVFLDPPYESGLHEPLLRAAARLLAPDGVAVAEHFHKRPPPETIGGLARTRLVRVGEHALSFYAAASAPAAEARGGEDR
jgi:16S rRNA (guanine(966)-N(2))-methyltransferase RsmD